MKSLEILRLLWQAIAAWWNDNAHAARRVGRLLHALRDRADPARRDRRGGKPVRGRGGARRDRRPDRQLVGTEGGKAVQALLQGATRKEDNILAATIGGITFVLAACGAFLELQAALNTIWRVKPAPDEGQLKAFFLDRLRSFGLVVAIGFLLLVSLAVNAALAAFATWLEPWAPAMPVLLYALNFILSVAVTAALFGLLFKFLPDVELKWRDVATGATVTALLFAIGKHIIGLYLGQSSTTSSYGAAGSVIVLLLWVYLLVTDSCSSARSSPGSTANAFAARFPRRISQRRPGSLRRLIHG